MDDHGYPLEGDLRVIDTWQIETMEDVEACLDWIGDNCWHFADWGWSKEGKVYSISTGGWSGNEETLSHMKSNFLLWSMCFVQHSRGGHYILEATRGAFDARLKQPICICQVFHED